MKVLKFGGSSVGKPERIRDIVSILKNYYLSGQPFTVVFSAFGGVTDQLIEMSRLAANGDNSYLNLHEQFRSRHLEAAEELLVEPTRSIVTAELENNQEVLKNLLHGVFLVREASLRTMDYVLSFGERSSAFIISHVLKQAGMPASYLDARKIIRTDKNFGNAKVDFETTYFNIKEFYAQTNEIQIVTGFIGAGKGGLTTTLGRGGSDYTAALLGAGLEAEAIEIWTDVDGVLTADPRKVPQAFTIHRMTYAEAMEMSHFGAKVIYPPTIQPALTKKIPLYIKNTFNPSFEGTLVSNHAEVSDNPVKGISSIQHIALLTLQGSGLIGVPGISGRLFSGLAQKSVNIILITQGSSEHSISFAIQPDQAQIAAEIVEGLFETEMQNGIIDRLKVETDLAVVAVIGERMRYFPGVAGRLFQSLGKNGINVVAIAQGSSELNISVVISRLDESKALNVMHEAFFLSHTKTIHLFMVGCGLIGSTLLNQIRAQEEFLKNELSLDLKLVGLANSKKMFFNRDGISLHAWKETLNELGEPTNLSQFVAEMEQSNLPNAIFVDNTANEEITRFYEPILNASISISTPNKIANSSGYEKYAALKSLSKRRGVMFCYETNVGAGLPVLSTLTDLINSGDRIIKIEAVLSGSLSYIFNTFGSDSRSFCQIVEEAMALGFTEPDPRIDLNGIDLKRKLMILAREAGYSLEGGEVVITSVLSEKCQKAPDVSSFLKELENENDSYRALYEEAMAANQVLRIVAKLEDGDASISLKKLSNTHPFSQLSGSDNMIVFTTSRYKERPLVIRGPGAGAEVTAAGIFSEIIKIAHQLN
jgi:aspartokinase/homoserine dehydrogenase 1